MFQNLLLSNINLYFMKRHRKAFEKFRKNLEDLLGDGLDQVILFGSVARGEASEESDVDVLVVLEDKSLKDKVFDISYEIMLEKDVYISPKVVSKSEFEDIQETQFIEEIKEENNIYGKA